MDRAEWIKEKRKTAEQRYDTLFSPDYDKNWGQIEETYIDNLRFMLGFIPRGAVLLDAACGTGKYWPMLLAEGYAVTGIDQSQKMLDNALRKFPSVHVEKIGLQEIPYISMFHGIVCMDAMENVFPEDWMLVLNNFHRALKKRGYLYFTVETTGEDEMETAYQKGLELGYPVVKGEFAHEGGYHYYPSIETVKAWIHASGFVILKENTSSEYEHFILGKRLTGEV